MTHAEAEIATQPDMWLQAGALAGTLPDVLPRPGERALVIGCGTSLYMGQAYAARREAAGQGETGRLTGTWPACPWRRIGVSPCCAC